MYYSEYKAILLTFNIDNPVTKASENNQKIWFWNDLYLTYDGINAKISGKIPFSVIEEIFTEYPNNPYKISIGNTYNYEDIIQYVKTDKDDNKFYDNLTIFSKEGFINFLMTIEKFEMAKKGEKSVLPSYDEIIALINILLISEINPSITSYEWMEGDPDNRETFKETLKSNESSSYGRDLRTALDKFDNAVNPFQDPNIDLDTVFDFSPKVAISANAYSYYIGKIRPNSCFLDIKDITNGGKASYFRNSDGFGYSIEIRISTDEYLTLSHYYSAVVDKGEVLEVNYFGSNSGHRTTVKYNITKDLQETPSDDKIPISQKLKNYIYDELIKGTEVAKSITIDNMAKKSMTENI